jgi:hypothetical protein
VQTGVVAPELKDLPSLPLGTEHIWRWFCDLDAKRTSGWSMNPITWSDIHAYFGIRRVRPQPWELTALARLDDTFITSRIKPVAGSAQGAKALKQRMTGKAAK